MNTREIQIQFPRPGKWDEFTLTAVYPDGGGFTRTASFTQNDIPVEQTPVMQSVVEALVGLGEDWQAVQVWARLGATITYDVETGHGEYVFAVKLTVEAVNLQGGRRIFTVSDYPAFVITDPAAVAFFSFFTTASNR